MGVRLTQETGNGSTTLVVDRVTPAERGVQLCVLGGMELRVDGDEVSLPMSAQRLLAFLAIMGQQQHRHYVAGTLWTDSTESRAASSLRSAVWRLRQSQLPLVETRGPYLRISRAVEVDFAAAMAAVRRLLDPCQTACPTTVDAQLGKDLLPDWYDEWVVLERERYRQLRMHALERLSERLAARGRFAEAVEAALEAVRGEPLRESAHRVLIRVHAQEGNIADALEHYHAYRRRLSRELGLAPSHEMLDLVSSLLRA